MKDADKIKAATLLVHGTHDFNVMTKNAAQLWDVLKAQQRRRASSTSTRAATASAPPRRMANRWFTKYLWGQDNGVQNLPKSWVVREADQCPPRDRTVVGAVANATTLTVASASRSASATR